ncbi:hypothetical protein KKF82_08415 [Patescibacteria group bacterium]|nr:hypothetical protein [Patescibacteria group bacterium]
MGARQQGIPFTDLERAAEHFGVDPSEVTPEMLEQLPPRGTGWARGIGQDPEEGSTWKGLAAIGIMLLGIVVVDRFTGGKTTRWLT